MKTYLFNILLALDILASAILAGRPGETMSGRAGTAQREGALRGRILAPVIDFIMRNPKHCQEAILNDVQRAKAVVADDSSSPTG
ncbi:MAG: hypothetical protein ACRETL_01945 [Gammaproteobacteria bacterium]